MSERIRQLCPNAEYHVSSSIDHGDMIFEEPEAKLLFVSVLKRAKKKYMFSVKNFCLMGNHFHMIIKPLMKKSSKKDRKKKKLCESGIFDSKNAEQVPPVVLPEQEEYLPAIIQWIKSVFAKAWNKNHDTHGHVWDGPYFSRIILSRIDFLNVFKYIDDNPVKAGLAATPEQYKYGRFWKLLIGLLETNIPP